mmetsp:Transcript_35350/g.36008  ORF Transcript_35350/g.36008 Transcript_35350/m.36008 type:complete len:291 (+) Transcript_35350:58-930(+)
MIIHTLQLQRFFQLCRILSILSLTHSLYLLPSKSNRNRLHSYIPLNSNIPTHVAYIVDGNGRWATEQGLSRSEGHRAGANTTINIVKSSFRAGISIVTLYIFSSENWKRPVQEVANIMELLERKLIAYRDYFIKNNIRVCVIGERERLPFAVRELIGMIESDGLRGREREGEREREKRTLCLAISYGGRQDIVQTCKSIATLLKKGEIREREITEQLFTTLTSTGLHKLPDPDLIIRTSGEFRLSNFLLWQCAYSEFSSINVYWPDFTEKMLNITLENYAKRERKFGGLL